MYERASIFTLKLSGSESCPVISCTELQWHLAGNHLLPPTWYPDRVLGHHDVWMVLEIKIIELEFSQAVLRYDFSALPT